MAFEEVCFPSNLRKIRLARGIKMTDVARETGLSLSAMSKIEKGYRRINQKTMLKLCDILGCKVSDIFIKDSDTEAICEWRDEMGKRVKSNESSGLKIFGAGLRLLRRETGYTIIQAAKVAKMTLSVYHNIEVGRRDIYPDEFENIANMLGVSTSTMVEKIKGLYESGVLSKSDDDEGTKQKANLGVSKIAGVSVAEGLYGDKMYELARNRMIPIFGKPGDTGILFKKSDEKMIIAPSSLNRVSDAYAVIPNPARLNGVLSARAYALVNPNAAIANGDLAILFPKNFADIKDGEKLKVEIVVVKISKDGKKFGMLFNPEEKVAIPEEKGRLHKIIQIVMD